MTRWLDPPSVQIPGSFGALDLHPLAAQTLVRRGITELAEARIFLNPGEIPPTYFPRIEPALDLIQHAIHRGERICVWGDFDVDGQTSTTLLVQALQALGANVSHYIPVRARESHGVHVKSLKPVIEAGTKLLLTCDTGITAFEAIDYARAAGLEVVVTDHHDPGSSLPNANAILNPKLLPAGHPLSNLAGVGVAFKLAEALLEQRRSEIEGLLDLVALGLIADVALLKGETRSLAQRGIEALRRSERLGLRLIAEKTQTDLESLTEETIGFTIAPRLNALGRLEDANSAVDLLLSTDPVRVRVLVTQIENLNAQRRLLTSQVYQAAEAQLRQNLDLLAEPILILSNPHWPGGVVGIAASRLVERYNKPVILLSESTEGILQGSARSVEGLHITEAIASQATLLRSYGGHPMAAGLSLEADKLAAFRKGMGRAVERQLGAAARDEPSLQIDTWLGPGEMTLGLAEDLERLAPFGAGNPPLVFAVPSVQLRSITPVGKTREHLRLRIEDQAGQINDVMWWGAMEEDLPEVGSRFDIAFSMRASTFRGKRQLATQFIGFRTTAEQQPVEVLAPQIEIGDMRAAAQPGRELLKLKQTHPGIQVWAEGTDRALGKRISELEPAEELAVYTIPASASQLRRAVEIAAPQRIFLFSVEAGDEKPRDFLNRLAQLCKYALNQRSGQATINELASATSQREATVRHGLEWLRAAGHIAFDGEDAISIHSGDGVANPELQAAFQATVSDLLKESAAYRKYYASVPDPAKLL
jgi:single-stranded-DNA-specific exonuclease